MAEQNKYHQDIIELFEQYVGNSKSKHGGDYIGTSKSLYPINAPTSQKLLKEWLKGIPALNLQEYKDLLNSLALGKSHNEFQAIGRLLSFLPKLRRLLQPQSLDLWLSYAEGWAEVDSICQGIFTPQELLSDWNAWQKQIVEFLNSDNVHKRRASLVLLTAPVKHSNEAVLSGLAFKNIEKLKHEKDILITKAISWLLRDLVKHHRKEVEGYLDENKNTLPKLAIRETKNKLKSGRKSGK